MTEIDHKLRGMVSDLARATQRLSGQVESVSGQVRVVDQTQQQTKSELQALTTTFKEFVEQSTRTANVQAALTQVGVVEARVENTFGHYNVVRRSATGMLQAFDSGLVSEDVVQQISQEMMIQTPSYWLAPALVALAAWSADDPAQCENAVSHAFRRSPDRTSLFFTLVLRRQGRQQSSLRWLRHYLNAQDPTSLSREFAGIPEAISQGAFGPTGRQLLQQTLATWREQLGNDPQARDVQLRRWGSEMETLRRPVHPGRFPRLIRVSPEWPQLEAALAGASAHQALMDKYVPIMEAEPQPSERIEDAVDDILDQLVKDFDPEELPLRRELAQHQAVISHQGDLDAALKSATVDSASLERTVDFLTAQSNAALIPESNGSSPATQRVSVAACQEWFLHAHARFTRSYRESLPSTVTAIITASVPMGTGDFKLRPWKGSFNTDGAQLERDLGAHWDRQITTFVETLAYQPQNQIIALGVAVVLILVVLLGASAPFALILAAIVGGAWGLVIKSRVDTGKRNQDAARSVLHRHRQESIQQLRGARAELTDWEGAFAAAEGVEPSAGLFIASLAYAASYQAPFEGRTVENEGR